MNPQPTPEETLAALESHHRKSRPKVKAAIHDFIFKPRWEFSAKLLPQLAIGAGIHSMETLGQKYLILVIFLLPLSITLTRSTAIPYKPEELRIA